MELRTLRYFIVAAQCENLTRASVILNVTQPALSRQISLLEEELGTPLFVRTANKHLSITPAGQYLLKRAQQIVELEDETKESLKQFNMNLTGTIHFGASESISWIHVVKSLKEFKELYPNITYDFSINSATVTMEKLERDELDFALVIEPVKMQNCVAIRMPEEDRQVLLMRSDDPLSSLNAVTCEQLKNLPICMPERMAEWHDHYGWFGSSIHEFNIISVFNQTASQLPFVDMGTGYVITVEGAVNKYSREQYKWIPLDPEIRSCSDIVWKKSSQKNDAVLHLAQYMKSRFEMHK